MGEFCVLHLYLPKWDSSHHEIIIGGNFVSPFSTIKEANQSFHVIGEGHKPNSKGLSTHYKDSLSLPFSNHQTSKSKVIIEGLISDWPAFSDPTRTWRGDRWDSFMDEVDSWICLCFFGQFFTASRGKSSLFRIKESPKKNANLVLGEFVADSTDGDSSPMKKYPPFGEI